MREQATPHSRAIERGEAKRDTHKAYKTHNEVPTIYGEANKIDSHTFLNGINSQNRG